MKITPIAELLISSTSGVLVQFLLEKVKEYKEKKSRKTIFDKAGDIEELENALEPFKEKLNFNEAELKLIKENVEKLSRKLEINGFDVTDEAYQRWALDLLNRKLKGIKQARSTFGIELWTERIGGVQDKEITIREKKYRVGDRIVLYFKSERDCYLTLFNVGTSGKLTVLFPNYLIQDNFIRANEICSIPGRGWLFEYELSGPRGIEKIKAIATTSRHDLLDLEFSRKEFFHSAGNSTAARDISIVEKRMESVPDDSWAEAMYEFEVI